MLRSLFDEAWRRARRRRRRWLLLGGVATAVVVVGVVSLARPGSGGPSSSAPLATARGPISLRITPSIASRHDRVVLTITAAHATGVVDRSRRSYAAEIQALRPGIDCVNNRAVFFPNAAAGTRIGAALDPARGDGGPQGWCPGVYRGTINYADVFACPAAGTCHPPIGFMPHLAVVARFTYRVR